MSKEKNTFKEEKKPLTIKVSTFVPYALLIAFAIAFAGIVLGWNLRSGDVSRIEQAQAQGQASVLKAVEQK